MTGWRWPSLQTLRDRQDEGRKSNRIGRARGASPRRARAPLSFATVRFRGEECAPIFGGLELQHRANGSANPDPAQSFWRWQSPLASKLPAPRPRALEDYFSGRAGRSPTWSLPRKADGLQPREKA